eukprot:Tamp_34684.p1 GENE.Tamp_34684~~Tamp_34684.p1  ORF type:complete len:109 (+),score=33.20 Tamp_34684:179-505(+)
MRTHGLPKKCYCKERMDVLMSHRADEWGEEGPPERIAKCFVCLNLTEQLFDDDKAIVHADPQDSAKERQKDGQDAEEVVFSPEEWEKLLEDIKHYPDPNIKVATFDVD